MPSRKTKETTHRFASVIGLIVNPMLLALGLAAAGWLGLGYVMFYVHPTPTAKGLLLALTATALTGSAWPVSLALHRRLGDEPPALTVWRQSVWVGAFGAAMVWLQMNRLFNAAWALVVAGVLVVIELILVARERQEAQHDD